LFATTLRHRVPGDSIMPARTCDRAVAASASLTRELDIERLAEAAVAFYDVPEDEVDEVFQEIKTALHRSGVDAGRTGEPSVCTLHADQMSNDRHRRLDRKPAGSDRA
jgi:hypothetical protein